MTFIKRWVWLWNRSYIPQSDTHCTRLKASAPVVTQEEVERLERKWRQQPIDLDKELPIG